MAKYVRRAMKLNTHDVSGNIDRVIEYLTGVKKSLESQGCVNIQFGFGYDPYEEEVTAEIAMEVNDDCN